jgi:trimeric autotransporter adhesin
VRDDRASAGLVKSRCAAAAAAALLIAAAPALGGGTALASQTARPPGVRAGVVAGIISTIAGGVGGPAKATRVAVGDLCGVSVGDGFLYAASGSTVRKVSPQTDQLTTPAGTGATGPLGDGGPAGSASVNACGTATDPSGNLVIADSLDSRIRVVAARTGTFYGQAMKTGDIYTVAGNGTQGFSGDGGPATLAEIYEPWDVTVDGTGNLVIADSQNERIRVVAASTGTFYGQAMKAGDIYTVAGNGTAGGSGDGGPAGSAELSFPQGVTVDGAGNLVIADTQNQRIRVVAARAGTFYGQAMKAGDIYTVAGTGLSGYSGDGGPATGAELSFPTSVALDGTGNLVIADMQNNRIRVVATGTGTFYGQAMKAGDIYTVAGDGTQGYSGDGGPATGAELGGPGGVAVDGTGKVVIADEDNSRIRVVAASTGTFYDQAMTAGDIYTVAGNGTGQYSGDGASATKAELNFPQGVAVDGTGNLVMADTANYRIRVAAASTGTFYGQAMTAGDIYTVAGNGTGAYSGDGGPATKAELQIPQGVAVDSAGDLLIADTGNMRVRIVPAATGTFYGQAMTAGDIYTVAGNGTEGYSGDGGLATKAQLSFPGGVAVDGSGNLVIADTGNNVVRVVAARAGRFYGQAMKADHIYTVAGNGTSGYSGDGGPGASAELNDPGGVAVDSSGNLLIADTFNDAVRVVAGGNGTFYGQAMTAGDIYTVAGNGTAGYSGDGGPATSAELSEPGGVAADGVGGLVIADSENNRIR